MKADIIHVALFAAFLLSGAEANIIFLRMWSRLDSIGATPRSPISFWATANTLKNTGA
jgi:hypothetical protein